MAKRREPEAFAKAIAQEDWRAAVNAILVMWQTVRAPELAEQLDVLERVIAPNRLEYEEARAAPIDAGGIASTRHHNFPFRF